MLFQEKKKRKKEEIIFKQIWSTIFEEKLNIFWIRNISYKKFVFNFVEINFWTIISC